MAQYRIDPEFETYIFEMQTGEQDGLRADIRANGCREPVIIWRGLLIDGHHRARYCQEIGVTPPVLDWSHKFATRAAVKAWMYANVVGRRNASPDQLAALAARDGLPGTPRGDSGEEESLLRGAPRRGQSQEPGLLRGAPRRKTIQRQSLLLRQPGGHPSAGTGLPRCAPRRGQSQEQGLPRCAPRRGQSQEQGLPRCAPRGDQRPEAGSQGRQSQKEFRLTRSAVYDV